MAKVTDIKFEIKGEAFKVNVNCTSAGQFTANIPKVVADALHLDDKLVCLTLHELEDKFHSAINRYKAAETLEELFILIQYASYGEFNKKPDGYPLFGGSRDKYQMGFSSWDALSSVGFDYKVCIRETVDGKESWFNTRLGSDFMFGTRKDLILDKYYKDGSASSIDKFKKIPFSAIALQTLIDTQEALRKISEALFNFIEQDEKQIEQTLTSQKLLG